METEAKQTKMEGKTKRGRKKRWDWCRVYPVDFMKAEDALHTGAPSKLEMEVKEKLASAPSPFEILAVREESRDESQAGDAVEIQRLQLYKLVEKTALTKRQKECFRLLCVERMSIAETAGEMGVGVPRVMGMFEQIKNKLKQVLAEEELTGKINNLMEKSGDSLTPLQRRVLFFRYGKGMTIEGVAKAVRLHSSSVYRVLSEVLSKLK